MHTHLVAAILGIASAIVPCGQIALTQTPLSMPPITDRVVSIQTKSGQGSGVIIDRAGNTYTILTAAHVVGANQNPTLKIGTADRQEYLTSSSQVRFAPNSIDLATVTFQSESDYPIATIGDSIALRRGQKIFAVGFLGASLRYAPGKIVASSQREQPSGYQLVLGNAEILPGMSGGGLFTEHGTLIGIDGKGVGTASTNATQQTRSRPVSGLAIPIATFVRVASQMQIEIPDRAPQLPATEPTADDYFVTAQHKSQRGDYLGAVSDYNLALALAPDFSEVYFRRGIARSLLKNWLAAVADYTQAIAANPDYVEAYIQRGNALNAIANWQQAKVDFDIAIRLDPQGVSAYIGRGTALCELNDCHSGLQDYDRAIALSPANAYAYSSRGYAYQRLGEPQQAVASYLAAAELFQRDGKDQDYLATVAKIRKLVKR